MLKKLLVYKVMNSSLRTKDLETGESLSLKTRGSFKHSELETITFDVEKEWTFNKQKYASGKILARELILSNIDVPALEYQSEGIWDPHESYGDEADEYFPDYIREGYREEIVFKDYSGYGFYKQDDDPIFNAVEYKEAGNWNKAYDILTKLWEDYPQCIDALVHIGNLHFNNKYSLHRAYNCYKVAVDIVESKFPKNFDGIMLWIQHENRPFLRALNGLCLILWKLQKYNLK